MLHPEQQVKCLREFTFTVVHHEPTSASVYLEPVTRFPNGSPQDKSQAVLLLAHGIPRTHLHCPKCPFPDGCGLGYADEGSETESTS